MPGVTVIIYDQRCATEARRLRKRGLLPTPPARVVINEAVCEGCGDCRTKSNCASVLPYPTELGEKRRIDDVTCNRDYTCLEGDCPSFVTLVPKREARAPRAKRRVALPQGELPVPARAAMGEHFAVYFTGIGGTGVVTAGRLLTAAAEAAGLTVSSLDQTGLAQKGGAVVSHLHFARSREALGAAVIGPAGADLYLSGDIFQAASAVHLGRVLPGRTLAAVDRTITPTSSMQQTGELAPDVESLQRAVSDQVGEARAVFVDAQRIAEKVFAQNVLGNVVLLGAAFQRAGLPFSLADIEAGIARRGASAADREAFEWGRWAAHDPAAVQAALSGATGELRVAGYEPSTSARATALQLVAAAGAIPAELVDLVQRRTAQVIDYQDVSLARRYLELVTRTLARDNVERGWELTRAVAQAWFRLLTYKDEYEVARLHRATRYDLIARDLGIEGGYTLEYHLHPPFLRRLGLKHKLSFGWLFALVFMLLRSLKRLRGTPLEVFGWDRDRQLERALIAEYRQRIEVALADAAQPYAANVELARSALAIKGYGPVKERSIAAWRTHVAALKGP